MTLKSIFSFLFILIFLISCNRNPLDVDTSNISIKTGFVNLDSIFVHSDSNQLIFHHHENLRNIQEIYEYELGYCLRIGNVSDTALVNSMRIFLADPYISRLEKRIKSKFSDLSSTKTEIISGLKHLKYHVKDGAIPEYVVFMNSFFASSAFSTEKQIGIGLERYLGASTDVIKELPPQVAADYEREGMDAKFMSRDALCSWIMTHYVKETDGFLAENIVRWGKILYLTKAAFPELSEAHILRYSDDDYDWAIKNEYAVWKYLVDQKMLFKNNELNTKNMLGDGPFTPGLPEKGPDRLGQFIGLRIIEQYIENTDSSVEKLLEVPYQEILVEYQID